MKPPKSILPNLRRHVTQRAPRRIHPHQQMDCAVKRLGFSSFFGTRNLAFWGRKGLFETKDLFETKRQIHMVPVRVDLFETNYKIHCCLCPTPRIRR